MLCVCVHYGPPSFRGVQVLSVNSITERRHFKVGMYVYSIYLGKH